MAMNTFCLPCALLTGAHTHIHTHTHIQSIHARFDPVAIIRGRPRWTSPPIADRETLVGMWALKGTLRHSWELVHKLRSAIRHAALHRRSHAVSQKLTGGITSVSSESPASRDFF